MNVKQYIEYIRYVHTNKNNITTNQLFNFLEGTHCVYSILELNTLTQKYSYLFEDLAPHNILELNNKVYIINKNIDQYCSIEQWQNIDELLKGSTLLENICIILGILIQNKNDYDYSKAQEYAAIIEQKNAEEIIPIINFFLSSEEQLYKSTLQFLKKTQKMQVKQCLATLYQAKSIARSGGGTMFLTRWLTMTYLNLIIFYVKLQARFLRI